LVLLASPLTVNSTPPAERLTFELPADAAGKSLLRFSDQSGLEVLFATQAVAGITTRPVHGDYSVMEAANLMLKGTGLEAVQTEPNGVLNVRRRPTEPMKTDVIAKFRRALASTLLLLGGQVVQAQEQAKDDAAKEPKKESTAADEDEVVTLSAFTVSSTQGKGYVANDAMSGLKSKQLLIDIPQSIQVVPRDLIEDLGQLNNTIDTLRFAASGTATFAYGEVVIGRGFRGPGLLIDGQSDMIVVADPVSYDSIEVLKGPAAVLYGNRTSLNGTIVKHTRKPLSFRRNSVRAIAGEGGMMRGEFDFAGPAAALGGTKVSYRFYGALQEFDGFGRVDFDNRSVIGGGLKFDFNADTSLLVQADNLDNDNRGISNNFQNQAATGTYFGPGYDAGYKSKWSQVHYDRLWAKATLTHRFNESWDVVASLSRNSYNRKDREVRNAGAPDYVNNIIPQYFFGFDYQEDLIAFQLDVAGNYTLGGMKNISTLGFSADRGRSYNTFWFLRPDSQNPGGNVWTSITNPQIYDRPMPEYSSANRDAPNRGVRVLGYGYYMHTLELLPDKLSVIAGISGNYLNGNDRNQVTGTVADLLNKATPRRLGIVYKPFNGFALYANNSTAFQLVGARDASGSLLPPIKGEVLELGFKTALKDGRISSTVTYFDFDVTGIPIANPPSLFQIPAGKQNNTGFEVDLAFRPVDDWQIIATYYSGDMKGVDGKRLANSINKTWSLVSRYDFSSGPMKGVTVGVSAYHQGDRTGAAWPAFTTTNLFAGYARDAWSLMVNMDNLEDKQYSFGGWGAFYQDVAAPRNAKVTFAYRF
jgi:iron complex outermembrane receptor protein